MFAVHQECHAQAWVSHGEQVRLVAGTMQGMCGPGVRGWGGGDLGGRGCLNFLAWV